MSRDRFESPRPEKKKKSLGEGAGDARQARISFKNYLRELEEQNEYDEDDLYEEESMPLPDDDDGIEEIYQGFLDENEDLVETAREKEVDEAVDFMMDELEIYLQNKGYSISDIRDWMEGPAGEELSEKFYNGLT